MISVTIAFNSGVVANSSRTGQKDLSLALAGAAQLMQVCPANGGRDLDHSSLVNALDLMG